MPGICSEDTPKKKKFRKRKYTFSTGRNAGHRFRGNPKMDYREIDWDFPNPSVGVQTYELGTLLECGDHTREMYDTHGYWQNHCNPCIVEEHQDGTHQPLPPIVDSEGVVVDFKSTTPSFRSTIREAIPFLSSAQLDELALKSEQKLSKVIDPTVSIANFILEIIELIHGNIKSVKRFKNLYDRMRDAFEKAYLRLRKQGHKEASAYWLAWNFAIKPFIKDLRSIICSMQTAHKRLAWIRDHNHKEVILHYQRRDLGKDLVYDPFHWYDGFPLCTVTRSDPSVNGLYLYQVRVISAKLQYHAFSKIFLEIPDHLLERGDKGVGAMWAAVNGLTNPIGIVWEAIPFTWLIDYFLSYRSRLFQTMYDFNPFDEGVTVLGMGHAFTMEMGLHVRATNVSTGLVHHDYQGASYKLYSREKGLPYPEQASLFRVPDSWYKGSIIAALAIQLMKRRKSSR